MKAVVKSSATHKGIAFAKVKELRKLYTEMQSLFLAALDKAIRMGEILSEVKNDLPHGQFGTWVENAGLPFKARTAQLYMRLYERKEELYNAEIGTVGEAQKFLSSGGNIDKPNTQSFAYLEEVNSHNHAGLEETGKEFDIIKLTTKEKQLVATIVEAGGDQTSAETGIKIEKLKAKRERERRQEERNRKKELNTTNIHFKNLEVPPNLYRRFARVAKNTGRPIADILQEAADALAKQQKKK